jgi:lysophospholipase L1-like esterase
MTLDTLFRCAALSSTLAVAIACGVARAQDPAPSEAAAPARCSVEADLARFDLPLTHLAHRLATGMPVKIVAIGSSSTSGFGATSPANTYPSRLEAELRQQFPGHVLTVVNRGVNNEEISNMLVRFETAVVAERPQLVIWQFGSNALMHDKAIDPGLIAAGIARLKAIGTDVVLMDPQYAPRVLAKPAHEWVVAQIARAAKENKADVLHRFEMMRHWHEAEGLPFETFLIWDGLHLNDWGYACVAKSLGAAIAEAASRPTAKLAVTTRATTKVAGSSRRHSSPAH